jgi:hypothetical protein
MRTYWNVIGGCAAAMLLLVFVSPILILGSGAVMLAAWLGTKVPVSFIERLQTRHPMQAVAIIGGGVVVMGVGALLHIALLWALGMATFLTLVFGGIAKDVRQIG